MARRRKPYIHSQDWAADQRPLRRIGVSMLWMAGALLIVVGLLIYHQN